RDVVLQIDTGISPLKPLFEREKKEVEGGGNGSEPSSLLKLRSRAIWSLNETWRNGGSILFRALRERFK
ncbi:hypothetical protein PJO47_29400, partial [Mycobacterium kansasii]